VPCLCELYLDICLTAEKKAWKYLSQGSQRVPVGRVISLQECICTDSKMTKQDQQLGVALYS